MVSITGIAEPAEKTSWNRQMIPPGFFEVTRWELQRENSRLLALDPTGTPTGVSYIACQLSASAAQHTNPGKIEELGSPSAGNVFDHNTHKRGFVGRPSKQEWVLEELKLRGEKGILADLLKNECVEVLAAVKASHPGEANYPTEKTIKNIIRHNFKKLKSPK